MRKENVTMFTVGKTVIGIWFISVFLAGCVPIGATRFPQASENFLPKKEYAASFENTWASVHDVLNKNRIVVAAENKSEGRITTDYVQGQGQADAFGLLGVISTRYKYAIRLTRAGSGNITIAVLANLESSGDAMPAWRDISNDNKGIVAKLENWLYEQIQKRLVVVEY